jgi:hypothetical protein
VKLSPLGFGFVATLALAVGCSSRSLTPDAGTGTGGTTGAGGAGGAFTPTRKVDMLFLMKDGGSTRLIQDSLLRNFPVFMQRLMDPPGQPDLRIAVVTSDLGAGDGSISGCDATGGKNGVFQYMARGVCTASGLDPGATYISDTGTSRNFTGNLADVFTCIAAVGSAGCGFEHELAAITRALGADGKPAPAENQGFLRDDAFLFVVVLTDEDDCSAPPNSGLFDTKDGTTLASPLGPVSSYRCNEFGHLCNGQKPPRLAPNGDVNATVPLAGCTSAEGAGMLTPVATLVSQLRALKPFPDQQIVVAAIAGPPAPYVVGWRPAPSSVPDTGPWPYIERSCAASDGSFANPAVRIAQWVQAFGPNGLLLPVCSDDFGPLLDRMASLLNARMAGR